MSFPRPFDAAIGVAAGWRSIKVNGRATDVAQTYVPVASGLVYRTPQVGGEMALRIRSGGNVNDTAAGSGAQQITLRGLSADGLEVTETIATAGASASLPTSQKFLRLFEAIVSSSGTYATQASGSHAGDISIEDTSGNLWATIDLNGFPEGVSRVGAYTTPADYEGFLIGARVNADTGKTADALVFQRQNVTQVAAPYGGMNVLAEIFNVTGFYDISYDAPIYIPPLTDIGVMARVDVQTARVGSSLGLLLRRV